MRKRKLRIMIGQEVYEWLHEVVGRRRIGKFIKALVRPYVTHHDLEGAYAKMAANEEREAEALEWAEATVGDVADEVKNRGSGERSGLSQQ